MENFDFTKWYTAKELSEILNANSRLIYYYANKQKIRINKSERPYKFQISPIYFDKLKSNNEKYKTDYHRDYDFKKMNDKERISILMNLKLMWQELIDDPNRYTIIKWLGVIGSVASIIALILPSSNELKLTTNPSELINNQMKKLLEYDIDEDSLFQDERVKQINYSIINLSQSSQFIDDIVITLKSYLEPNNSKKIILLTVKTLADLCLEFEKGTIKKPKGGFFKNTSLSDLNLSGLNLYYCDFINSKLSNINLSFSKIENNNFTNANFINVKIDSAFVGFSDFSESIFKECSFAHTIISKSSFREANFEHIKFNNAYIFYSSFISGNFLQCEFLNSNILICDFQKINTIQGIEMENEPCYSGTGIDFSTVNFYWEIDSSNTMTPSSTIFPSMNSYYFSIPLNKYTDFSSAKLRFANFSNNCIIGLKFSKSDLYGADFNNSNISNVDFYNANLACSSFINSNLINTQGLPNVKNFFNSDFSNGYTTSKFYHFAIKKGIKISQNQNSYQNRCFPLKTLIELPITFDENKENYEVVLKLGKYTDVPEEPNQAIEYYTNILKDDPEEIIALTNRAILYLEIREYEKALFDLNKAIEISPTSEKLYANRSYFYIQTDSPKEALKDANIAIKIDPSFAEAYNNKGISYGMLGEFELAIENFEKALEIDSNHTRAKENLDRAKYYLNREKKN